jgi:glycerate dehydrogenase
MRLTVLDGYTLNPGDNPWTELERLGELVVFDRTPPELVAERARGSEIVLVNKVVVDRTTLSALEGLKAVCVLATGYNVVDVVAARERGVVVCNVPDYATDSVAEHTFALLFEVLRHTGDHAHAVASGEWTRSPDFCFWKTPLVELAGKSFGIVGFGRIGRRVAAIADAFGMSVRATRPRRDPSMPALRDFAWSDLDSIFAECDVVSLSCPLTDETATLVNERRLARMKPTAVLINTARGPLVDEAALARALEAGKLRGAALDVVSAEPMRADNPLLAAQNAIVTPHVAWASLEARRRLMAATVDNVRAILAGTPIHVVSG